MKLLVARKDCEARAHRHEWLEMELQACHVGTRFRVLGFRGLGAQLKLPFA